MNQLICEVQGFSATAFEPKNVNAFPRLTNELQKLFPNGRLHFYGSHVMGVATRESDVDVYIELENSYYNPMDREKARDCIKFLTQKMQNNISIWQFQFNILTGRVPCVRAFFKPTKIYCDITFTSGLAVENSKLIKHLFSLQPEAKKFCVFMKKWLKCNDVAMKGYNVILLCIFYFQQKDLLPSVAYLQALGSYSNGWKDVTIGNYQVQFFEDSDEIEYKPDKLVDFRREIRGFFEFYKDFDYKNFIISPYLGSADKKDIECEKHWNKPMSLAGPIVQDLNQTSKVSEATLKKFIQLCKTCAKYKICGVDRI